METVPDIPLSEMDTGKLETAPIVKKDTGVALHIGKASDEEALLAKQEKDRKAVGRQIADMIRRLPERVEGRRELLHLMLATNEVFDGVLAWTKDPERLGRDYPLSIIKKTRAAINALDPNFFSRQEMGKTPAQRIQDAEIFTRIAKQL